MGRAAACRSYAWPARSSWARRASRQRIDAADDDLELARGDGAEQVGDHRRDLVAARDQVHEPEADHCARVSQQMPGARLRSARARRCRRVTCARTGRGSAGRHRRSRRRSSRKPHRPVAAVGREDRLAAGPRAEARVDCRVGAQPRRRALASPRSRRARSPGRRRAWRAGPRGVPVPPAAAWTTTVSPGCEPRAAVHQRVRREALEQAARRPGRR